MSFNTRLEQLIKQKQSFLCIGIDPDIEKLPPVLHNEQNPILKFVVEIIKATKDIVIAYKTNLAFFEYAGNAGMDALYQIRQEIPEDVLLIADGKRGDIGNTAEKYALAAFRNLKADAVTVNPYMGYDAVEPFIRDKQHGVFILTLTSNKSAKDFQYLKVENKPLYHLVAESAEKWNENDNCGLVIGATKPEELKELRAKIDNLPFLVPGIGAQGGDLETVLNFGSNKQGGGLVINVGRDIIFNSQESDFVEKAYRRAQFYKRQMISHII